MTFIRKAIIVEDKIKEVLTYLPLFINPSTATEHKHVFKMGVESEINAFVKKAQGPYPLIWLAYPFQEEHSLKKVNVDNLTLIIAVKGNYENFLEDRFENVFKGVLYNIFDNIRYLLNKSQNTKVTSEYSLTKFPNYIKSDEGSEKNVAIDVWDAVKVSFNCTINDKCSKL
jgi:hypothetical protein